MAKVQFVMPEEFLTKLSSLGDKTDEITEKVLKAGGEKVLEQVKSKLTAVIGKGTKHPSESTGELVRSLGLSPVKMDRDGNYNIKIGFAEPRSDGGSNAMVANVLEHGKHGQVARPFLKPAMTAAKKDCEAAMQAEFDKEVSKL